jgi:hypothetical protein
VEDLRQWAREWGDLILHAEPAAQAAAA